MDLTCNKILADPPCMVICTEPLFLRATVLAMRFAFANRMWAEMSKVY